MGNIFKFRKNFRLNFTEKVDTIGINSLTLLYMRLQFNKVNELGRHRVLRSIRPVKPVEIHVFGIVACHEDGPRLAIRLQESASI